MPRCQQKRTPLNFCAPAEPEEGDPAAVAESNAVVDDPSPGTGRQRGPRRRAQATSATHRALQTQVPLEWAWSHLGGGERSPAAAHPAGLLQRSSVAQDTGARGAPGWPSWRTAHQPRAAASPPLACPQAQAGHRPQQPCSQEPGARRPPPTRGTARHTCGGVPGGVSLAPGEQVLRHQAPRHGHMQREDRRGAMPQTPGHRRARCRGWEEGDLRVAGHSPLGRRGHPACDLGGCATAWTC